MIHSHKLLFLLLFCCSTSLFGMNQGPNNPVYNFITQKNDEPGAPMRPTGITETIVRDLLCGGWIVPSLVAASVIALSVEWESPCNLLCVAGRFVGSWCIAFPVELKMLGYAFAVANHNPTSSALIWRDRVRVLYGFLSLYVMFSAQTLAKYIFS